jgi:ribonuclease P protein component
MPASPHRLRLRRGSRLKQSREFARVKREGERVVCGCIIANWQRLAPESKPRIGVVVSSRVGDAVERSRARRLLRETFRLHQHDFATPVDLVLVARPSIARQKLSGVEKDFLGVMRRSGLLKPSL